MLRRLRRIGSRPPAGERVNVSTPAELAAALAAATGGETIQLANGADFGDLSLSSKSYATQVTIAGNGTQRFGTVDLTDVSRLSISYVTGDDQWTLQRASHCNVTYCDAAALSVLNSNNCQIQNNNIAGGQFPLNIGDTTRTTNEIEIAYNSLSDPIADLFRLGIGDGTKEGLATNINIHDNLFQMTLNANYEDHIDVCQFYSTKWLANQVGIDTCTVRDNIFIGTNDAQIVFQGTNLRATSSCTNEGPVSVVISSPTSQWADITATVTFSNTTTSDGTKGRIVVNSGDTFANVSVFDFLSVAGSNSNNYEFRVYSKTSDTQIQVLAADKQCRNYTIENNFIFGQTNHGFTITGTRGVDCSGNLILPFPFVPSSQQTKISLSGESDDCFIAENNIGTVEYPGSIETSTSTGIVEPPLFAVNLRDRRAVNYIEYMLVNPHGRQRERALQDVYPTPAMVAALNSAFGAEHPAIATLKARSTAPAGWIKVEYAASSKSVTVTCLDYDGGAVEASFAGGTTYSWDFGDDATDTTSGETATHEYFIQGDYKITCTLGGSSSGTVVRWVRVLSPLVTYLPLTSGVGNKGGAYLGETWSLTAAWPGGPPRFSQATVYAQGTSLDLLQGTATLSDWTIAVRYRVPSDGAAGAPVYAPGMLLLDVRSGKVDTTITGSTKLSINPLQTADNTYHLITLVKSGTTLSVYLDDGTTPAGSGTVAASTPVPTSPLDLGRLYSWDGYISEFAILRYALDCSAGADTALSAVIAAEAFDGAEPAAADFNETFVREVDTFRNVMFIDVKSHMATDAQHGIDNELISTAYPAAGGEARVRYGTGEVVGVPFNGFTGILEIPYSFLTNPGLRRSNEATISLDCAGNLE